MPFNYCISSLFYSYALQIKLVLKDAFNNLQQEQLNYQFKKKKRINRKDYIGIYKKCKTCSNSLFIKNQTADRMLPAINFRHGLCYHFKVRLHWPCLSGSLVSRRSLNTAHEGNIIKHVLGKLKLLAISTTEKLLSCLDSFTLQTEADAVQ